MRIRLDDLGGTDPYQLLGVDPSAARETIEAAHRRLMREAHPDVARGDGARATLLNLARDVLLDDLSRQEYDRAVAMREQSRQWYVPAPRTPSAPDPGAEQPWAAPQPDESLPDDLDFLMSDEASADASPGWRTGPALGVIALLLTVACFPFGTMVGIAALVRNRHRSRADRVCAWLAVALGTALLWVSAYALALSVGPSAEAVV